MPKQVQYDDALDTMWDELAYTASRLKADPDAKDLAPSVDKLVTDTEDTWKGQRQVWKTETERQAEVDSINFRADVRTDRLHADLTHANHSLGKQGEQRQARYFPIPKSKIIALALSAQLKYIDDYANSLALEKEESLREHSKGFALDSSDGKAAITALTLAVSARRNHRLTDIGELVKSANTTLKSVYGELLKRESAQSNKPKGWADSFFRKRQQNTPEERKIERQRNAVLDACSAFDIEMDDDSRKKVQQESKPEVLRAWLKNAATATTAAEVFTAKI